MMMKKIVILLLFVVLGVFSEQTNVDCNVCQLVVDGIEELVKSNSTVVQLEKYVETVCNVFPSYQTMCDSFVEKWMPYVVESVINNIPAVKICEFLNYC